MNTADRKKKILNAINKTKKLGLRIHTGSFGNPIDLKCCPMTALALIEVGPAKVTCAKNHFCEKLILPIVQRVLDVDEQWVLAFIRGFDSLRNDARSRTSSAKDGLSLGKDIHREIIDEH